MGVLLTAAGVGGEEFLGFCPEWTGQAWQCSSSRKWPGVAFISVYLFVLTVDSRFLKRDRFHYLLMSTMVVSPRPVLTLGYTTRTTSEVTPRMPGLGCRRGPADRNLNAQTRPPLPL